MNKQHQDAILLLEEKLKHSEKKASYISTLISDYVFTLGINTDKTFRVDYISDNYYKIAGQSKQDLFQMSNWDKVLYSEDLQKALETFKKCITDGKPEELVCRSRMLADQERWIHISLFPEWSDVENRVIAIWGAVKDITKQKQVEDAYVLKNTLLEAISLSSIDGILVVNKKNEKILQNRRTIDLWKIPPEIVENIDDIRQVEHVMHMTKNPQQFVELINFLREHPREICEDELELIDGTVLERYSAPVLDNSKNHYGRVWIFHDITKRKEDENKIRSLLAEKEIALKEVHHRMKNNMSTIMGLLTLQADMLSDNHAVQALHQARDRVQSMMMLYDKLYRSPDFLEMPVQEYLEELIEKITGHFPNRDSVKIETHIQDFILTAMQLSVIGILLNELLTNAMKHAFLGRETGNMTISVSHVGKCISIAVQDDGNGIPETVNFENSQGFGLTLIRMLAAQLDGNLILDRKGGTKISLEFDA